MLSAAALALLALAAGLIGTWSPCGLSATETIVAPEAGGDRRGRRAAAVAAFSLGCLLGGIVTFGVIALIGSAIPDSARWIVAIPLVAAAAGDAMGAPVIPRIARQVPEPWRRILPPPVALLAYGILLGLGLTTFVMSYALWASLVAVLLIGDPLLGVIAGVAFGVGRAVPVAAIAMLWERPLADRVLERMLLDGSALRRARRLAAAAAVLAALTLLPVAERAVATTLPGTYALSQDGDATALARRDGSLLAVGEAPPERLPGRDAAVGGGSLAYRVGREVVVEDLPSRIERARVVVPGVDALAVEGDLVVYRASRGTRSVLGVLALADGATPRTVTSAPVGALSRPSISGGTIVVARSDGRGSRILSIPTDGRRPRVARRARPRTQLLAPSLEDGHVLAWVERDRCRQRALVGPLRGRASRVVRSWPTPIHQDWGYQAGFPDAFNSASQCPGGRVGPSSVRLWGTALSGETLFLTVLGRTSARPTTIAISTARREMRSSGTSATG